MRFNRTILAALLICLVSCVHGTPSDSKLEFSAADKNLRDQALKSRISQPFLWEISKGDARSYLFGSMHIGIEPHKDLPLIVWRAFWAAQVFVSEIDFTKKRDWAQEWKESNSDLKSNLSLSAWNKLKSVFKAIPEENLRRMPPSIASFLYEWHLVMRQANLPIKTVLDAALFNEALKAGKKTDYLDDRHLLSNPNLFGDSADNALDLERILQMPTDHVALQGRRQLYETIFAYKKGNIDAITFVNSELADSSRYEKLIGIRNRHWMKKLLPILEAGDAFIAVGVAHMTGKDSLLTLLRDTGFNVNLVIL